jgi:hypothetical protein
VFASVVTQVVTQPLTPCHVGKDGGVEKTSSQEYSRRFRERSRRLEEAIEAAQSAARGMNRAEARQRIVAELRARGVVMSPPGVDLILQDIMLGTGAAGGIRRAAWHLANAADLTGRAIRFISAAARHQPLPRWDLGGARYLKPDRHVHADVILDPAAQELLAVGDSTITGNEIAILGGDVIEVWLDYPRFGRGSFTGGHGAGNEPAADDDQPLVVYYGEERVGILGPEASNAYRQAVREAHDAGVIPIIPATRSQADDSSWHLRLGLPIPRSYT